MSSPDSFRSSIHRSAWKWNSPKFRFRQLDDDRKDRKKSVLQFLYEAQLINKEKSSVPLVACLSPVCLRPGLLNSMVPS